MRFIDLFAGLGGFHQALVRLGHECVFASELNGDLANLYERNFESGPTETSAKRMVPCRLMTSSAPDFPASPSRRPATNSASTARNGETCSTI